MKKLLITGFLMFFSLCALAADPTEDEIRQAANTLSIPYADLRQFVQSYQSRTAPPGTIEITARQLSQEFQNNQIRASGQYNGKILQITGQMQGIRTSYSNEYYIVMPGTSIIYAIDIYIQSSELDKASNLNSGQTITIVGRCEGYSGFDVAIKDAYIMN